MYLLYLNVICNLWKGVYYLNKNNVQLQQNRYIHNNYANKGVNNFRCTFQIINPTEINLSNACPNLHNSIFCICMNETSTKTGHSERISNLEWPVLGFWTLSERNLYESVPWRRSWHQPELPRLDFCFHSRIFLYYVYSELYFINLLFLYSLMKKNSVEECSRGKIKIQALQAGITVVLIDHLH